ncbi:MAG: hypothetical protein JRF61_08405 [Deltaproteobacteria bacterium]|jgi:hypothetical protein|nr:hypothetical protein [Deltaproteobacteria bacterium]
MRSTKIIDMNRPFDPTSEDAEERYDTVVRRINQTRTRRARIESERSELERQFLESDLQVLSGSRRGEPLSKAGRRRRLARLVELEIEARQLCSEERFSIGELERMNSALDRWARETYGP